MLRVELEADTDEKFFDDVPLQNYFEYNLYY